MKKGLSVVCLVVLFGTAACDQGSDESTSVQEAIEAGTTETVGVVDRPMDVSDETVDDVVGEADSAAPDALGGLQDRAREVAGEAIGGSVDDAIGGAMESAQGLAGGLLGADSGLEDAVPGATSADLQDAALGEADADVEDLAEDPKETLLEDSKEKLSGLLNR